MLEKFFTSILILIGVIIYFLSSKFSISYLSTNDLGPAFFPKFLSIILCILGILLLIKKSNISINLEEMKIALRIIFCFGIYIFLISKIGYLVTTILFAFIVSKLLRVSNRIQIYIFSFVFPISLYCLFTYVFKVILPTGILI